VFDGGVVVVVEKVEETTTSVENEPLWLVFD
jgi:hypothetical protein